MSLKHISLVGGVLGSEITKEVLKDHLVLASSGVLWNLEEIKEYWKIRLLYYIELKKRIKE